MRQRDDIRVIVGLGAAVGLYLCLFWGPVAEGLLKTLAVEVVLLYTLCLNAGLAAGYAVLAASRRARALPRAHMVTACAACGVVGFMFPAAVLQLVGGAASLSIACVGAVLVGVSLAAPLLFGVRAIADRGRGTGPRLLFAAAALGFVVFAAVVFAVPRDHVLIAVFLGLYPAAMALFAWSPCRAIGREAADGPLACLGDRRTLVESCCCVVLLGVESVAIAQTGRVVQDSQLLIGACAAVATLVLWRVLKRSLTVAEIYLALFPLLASLLLLFPFAGDSLRRAVIVLSNVAAAFMVGQIALTAVRDGGDLAVVLEDDARGARGRAVAADGLCTTALLLAMFHAAVVVGCLVGPAVCLHVGDDRMWVLVVALVSLYVLSVLAFAMLRPKAGAFWPVRAGGPRDGDGPQAADPLAQSCRSLAERHGLSQREAQIMVLVAHGRDVPVIARRLDISQNTVRFHMKNIYRALDVHAKQELLDRIECEQTGDPEAPTYNM